LRQGPKSGGIRHIRILVAGGRYELSEKVFGLLADGYFELEDIESSIRTGRVLKSQKDELAASVGCKKYVITGTDTCGYGFYTVGKIMKSSDGYYYFFITAHDQEANYE